MASRSLLDPPRRAFTLQAFPFSGLVGAALLALASVTAAVAAVSDLDPEPEIETTVGP
jgi:hypothetical protein